MSYARVPDGVKPDIIRVVLADDHAVVRAGLRSVLGKAPDIEIVGEARSGREAVALTERFQPHVVVMDLDMDDGDGTWATKQIVSKGLSSRVLVLTMHTEEEHLTPALQAGVSGFLVKSAADRELVDAVRAVAYGDVYVRPSAARVLVRGLTKKSATQSDHDRFAELSDREQTVLRLVAQGFSGPEIGHKLSISSKTVETYKQRIHEKLGLSHRSEYIQLAVRLGFFEQ
ncbi:MAG TPA: response regulator transcription factor, partial [Candidatus Elarobacter sp.]|nr:response regulator transcription factor [Candidatus Elarobacter sp.]